MEKITVLGELLFELKNKQEWIDNIPGLLPRNYKELELIWVDKNGSVFASGRDFTAAEEKQTFPCKIYRLQRVSEA